MIICHWPKGKKKKKLESDLSALLQIRKLKLQLDEERHKNVRNDTVIDSTGLENGSDLQLIEMQSKCFMLNAFALYYLYVYITCTV